MQKHPFSSPFRYETPLQAGDLCDRRQELQALSQMAVDGRFVKLLAPRRYGKTSLLKAVFQHLEATSKATCLLCDLDGVVSKEDVALRLQDVYASQLKGRALRAVRDYLAAAGISLSVGGGSIRADLQSTYDPSQLIKTLIDAPLRTAEKTGKPTVVAFDEFQVVLELDKVDAILRSCIQHHTGNVGYIFCGSEPSMMERLFQDRARPLYGQAIPMILEPLNRQDLAKYIADRFEQTTKDVGTTLDPLLDLAEGHPQRSMMLAHALWQATPKNSTTTASALHQAITQVERETEPECEAIWHSLELGERRTLRAIAAGHTTSIPKSTQQTLELPRQTAQTARKRLIGIGILKKNEKTYRIVDPLLKRWIQRRNR